MRAHLIPAIILLASFVPGLAAPSPAQPPGGTQASDLVPSDWWTAVTEDLCAREYHVSLGAEGLQAPNRAQNLRTRFTPAGIEIVPRNSGREFAWSWTWQTVALGRPCDLRAVEESPATVDAFRVEYRRDGWTEWYENRPEGIEQGFTISAPPPGSGPLLLHGKVGGTLIPHEDEGEEAIEFAASSLASVLRYDGLNVTDVRGARLPSSMEIAEGAVILRVEDAGALYPILIDPIISAPNWTGEGQQVEARFGQCVATAGDVDGDGYSDVIVGAPRYDAGETNEGKAFLFRGSVDGVSMSYAWSAEGNQGYAEFASAVSTAGDVNNDGYDDVIVGAPYYSGGSADEGRIYLYYGSEDGLETTAACTKEPNVAETRFGASIAPAGDVNGDGYADFIVGASYFTNGQLHEGRIYVYYGSATIPGTPWTAELNEEAAQFGRCVAGAGDVNGDSYDDVIAGAPTFNNYGHIGRAYVYHGSETGIAGSPWIAGMPDWDGFGAKVAGAGDVNGDGYADVAISAPVTSEGFDYNGKVYLYYGSETGLGSSPAWALAGDQESCHFGEGLATAGDVNGDGYADLIIGAELYDDPEIDEGKAFLFLGRWFGLSTTPYWTEDGGQAGASFGVSVGTAGDVNGDGFSDLIVGADSLDAGQVNEGGAFVYLGSSDGPQTTPGWVTESGQAYAHYGYSVASAGDVNGDGFDDVLVGAEDYDNGQIYEGAAFLFAGSHTGLSVSPAWYAEGNQENALLGGCVASAGDVNGDGLGDILIGARLYDGSLADEGCALLWYGTAEVTPPGNPSNAPWLVTGGQAGAKLGYSLAKAGDVNGDGFGDVIVGAPNYDNPQVDEGAAFVYHGSAMGLSTDATWFHDCDHAGALYGSAVSTAGDFNGDGFSDVIVGSYLYDHPAVGEGVASVYLGSRAGVLPGAPYWYAEGNEENAWMGYSVACAGDVNGDGYSDVIIGAPELDWTAIDGGAVCIWLGGPTDPPNGNPDNADWISGRNQSGADLGWHVAGAGDVNGDGYSDVMAGAPWDGDDLQGRAFLWFGSAAGIPGGAAAWYRTGTQHLENFGFRVASIGDVNADGFGDVMVGAPNHSNGQMEEGRAFLYYGNHSRGVSRRTQQWQSDFSDPIATYGQSDNESAFGLASFLRTPAGRGSVRLVWEVKPYLTPFDGEGVGRGGWAMTGAPSDPAGSGAIFITIPSGLPVGQQLHWRMRFETKNPLFPRSKWLYLAGNGAGEADLRLAGWLSGVPSPLVDTSVRIGPSYPNPFTEHATLRFTLPDESPIRVTIHDVGGRLVRTIEHGLRAAGIHTIYWDGRDEAGRRAPGGVYLGRLAADGAEVTTRIVLAP